MDYEDISAINGYHEAFVDDGLVRVNVFFCVSMVHKCIRMNFKIKIA